MSQTELMQEYDRLLFQRTIQDSKDFLDIIQNCLFSFISNHPEEPSTNMEIEGKIVNQMIFNKVTNLNNALNGISYVSASDGTKLNNIIDPTIIAPQIRNIYEMVGTFNLIYIKTKTPDEKTILYNLWVSAGLKFRQRFESLITQDQNKEKLESEQLIIEKIKSDIESTTLYQSLEEVDKEKIQTKLKKKDFRIKFSDNKVHFLEWQMLFKEMGVDLPYFDHIYTYFSLYAHPSNVSVFQFKDMFSTDKPFIGLTITNLKICSHILCMFIADYIKQFPDVIETFNKLPIIDQIVINRMNVMVRNESYSINNAYEALG